MTTPSTASAGSTTGPRAGRHRPPIFVRGAELIAEVGMGDLDERSGAFIDALSEELRDAELGHDRPHVGARRDHTCARLEGCSDTRDGPTSSGGRQRDDGTALGGEAAPRMKSICPPTPE